MNVRLSFLLVAVLLIVGGAVVITQVVPDDKERRPQVDWIYKMDVDDIYGISVVHQDTLQVYDRQEDGQWVIIDGEDTPVFQPKWSGTTLILSGPRGSRQVADTIDDPAKYGLVNPQTTVQVIDKSGVPLIFHMGAATASGKDWYARVVGSERLFTVNADWAKVVSTLAIIPPYEPTRLTLNIDNLSRLSVTHEDTTVEYFVLRDNWVVREKDNPTVATEKWADTMRLLRDPRLIRVVSETIDDPAEYGLEEPQTTVSGDDKETGARILFHLGGPTPDGTEWYAKAEDSDQLFAVVAAIREGLLKLVSEPPYESAA